MKPIRPSGGVFRRAATLVPALAALAVLSTACGLPRLNAESTADDAIELDDGTSEVPGRYASGMTPTSGGVASAVMKPFDVNQTVWFAGFKVTLRTANFQAADKTLVVEGEAQNDGLQETMLDGDVRLEQDGVGIAEGRLDSDASILEGSTNAMKIKLMRLPATFNPDKAVLVIGAAKDQQVRVPLRGQNGRVTGEPTAQPALAPFKVGSLTITTDKLSVRHDNPQKHHQAPAGRAYIILEGNVRFDANTTNVQNENISLVPPNGSPQSPINVNALPRQGASEDIYAAFEMPTPIGGEYTLKVKGEFIASNRPGRILDTDASGELKFTLKVDPPATGSGAKAGAAGSSGQTGS